MKEFIEYMIGRYKTTMFGIDIMKYVLVFKYNKKSLMYDHIARKWFKQFFSIIQMSGFGTYDRSKMMLVLNKQNDNVVLWCKKYGVKK